MNPEVQRVIHDFLVAEFAPERTSIPAGENLLATGIIDSMGILRLVTFIEERFGFEASDEDMVPENFTTLEMIGAFVERRGKR